LTSHFPTLNFLPSATFVRTLRLTIPLLIVLSTCAAIVAQQSVSESYIQAAFNALSEENYAEAIRLANSSSKEIEKYKVSKPDEANVGMQGVFIVLSSSYQKLKKFPEAEKAERELIKLIENTKVKDKQSSERYSLNLMILAEILSQQKKDDEAENFIEMQLNTAKTLLVLRIDLLLKV
jgi:tetratricopeptide (TPR) repeat protein